MSIHLQYGSCQKPYVEMCRLICEISNPIREQLCSADFKFVAAPNRINKDCVFYTYIHTVHIYTHMHTNEYKIIRTDGRPDEWTDRRTDRQNQTLVLSIIFSRKLHGFHNDLLCLHGLRSSSKTYILNCNHAEVQAHLLQ